MISMMGGVTEDVNAMPEVIPLSGAVDPRMSAIKRRCMDRDGRVIRWLIELLPDGFTLEAGAGDGFTAERLTSPGRTVIPTSPRPG